MKFKFPTTILNKTQNQPTTHLPWSRQSSIYIKEANHPGNPPHFASKERKRKERRAGVSLPDRRRGISCFSLPATSTRNLALSLAGPALSAIFAFGSYFLGLIICFGGLLWGRCVFFLLYYWDFILFFFCKFLYEYVIWYWF